MKYGSDREWDKESDFSLECDGEDVMAPGEERYAAAVDEEWLANDEGEQLLSRSVDACDGRVWEGEGS